LKSLLHYLKTYPTHRDWAFRHQQTRDHRNLIRIIRKHTAYLAARMNDIELAWQGRFSPENKLPHLFDNRVTGSIDTFHIRVLRPKHKTWRRVTRNGKHRCYCMKVQMAVDHSGCPIWKEGPHLGVTHDSALWDDYPTPLHPAERLLADSAYIKFERTGHMIVSYKKPRGGELTREQRDFNRMHSWYRATVEHTNAWVKHWRILGGTYRGRLPRSLPFLNNVITVIINIAAFSISRSPIRTHTSLLHLRLSDTVEIDQKEDEIVDTTCVLSDFSLHDNVEWWTGVEWRRGVVKFIARRHNTLQIYSNTKRKTYAGIIPSHVRANYI